MSTCSRQMHENQWHVKMTTRIERASFIVEYGTGSRASHRLKTRDARSSRTSLISRSTRTTRST